MDNSVLVKVFGRGWAFPPAFNLSEGVVMAEGADDVQQSLRILFSTEPGERIMRENYGCALYDVMFENINSELINDIQTRILDAILTYEPRANPGEVRVIQASGAHSQVSVSVSYSLRGSQIARRLVGALDVYTPQAGVWV